MDEAIESLLAGEVVEAVAVREDFTYETFGVWEPDAGLADTVVFSVESGRFAGRKFRITVEELP